MLCLIAAAQSYVLQPQPLVSRGAVAAVSRSGPVVAAVAVDAKTVKTLRDATGAGMMDCKKALIENEGDMDAATESLRKKGLASAEKKAGRATKEGIIETCAPGYGAPPRAASRASLHRLHATYD